jgi:general secretion pathway protein D
MRQLNTCPLLVACLLTPLVVQAESGKSLYNKGKDAEAAQHYESAYEFYKQAYEQNPKDLRYRVAVDRSRFYAAAAKVQQGQILRGSGHLEEALAQFEAAAAIDPSIDIAQQEIRQTRRMIEEASKPPSSSSSSSPSSSPSDDPTQSQGTPSGRLEHARGPIVLQPISDQPINMNVTQDSRMVFETIGKLAGINVMFDPDYQVRRIHVELNNVSLEEALEVTAFESKSFWRPVTPNTILVAQDNPSKRKEFEQSVIKTFYLANVSQPAELQDIASALRSLLQIDRVQIMATKHAIAVRGTPDQIILAEKLIDDFDKAEPEVVVDVAIMQVNVGHTRNLGIAPPDKAIFALNSVGDAPKANNGGTPAAGGNSGSGNDQTPPTLFTTLKHLGPSTYAVTLPAATANFLFTDSDSRIIQSPQIRSVSGGKAILKIGERVPIATGSLSPLSGTGGGFNPVVQTQFQYQDVGVKVEITPTVHADHEITLKLAMEISSITDKTNVGGFGQPNIGQRTIENEIRLREGEVNLMAGMFEDREIKSWSGIPGLGQIPLFRHLFATHSTEHGVNELVFVLIPHIVRMQEVTPLNNRTLDVGGSTIELHETRSPAEASREPKPSSAPTSTQPVSSPVVSPPRL